MIVRLGAAICGVAILLACSSAVMAETGIASVYAYSGEKTANGEHANPGGLTAAHRTLAFGTHVRVTNQRNGRSIIVRINDRGPFVRGRVIDLTPAGARALGFSGLAPVKLETARTSGLAPFGADRVTGGPPAPMKRDLGARERPFTAA